MSTPQPSYDLSTINRLRMNLVTQKAVMEERRARNSPRFFAEELADAENKSQVVANFTAEGERVKKQLVKIDAALLKCDNGTYGRCSGCGQLISLEQLEACPVAALCTSCRSHDSRETKAGRVLPSPLLPVRAA